MQKNPKAIFNFISLAIHSKIHCSVILFCTRLLLNKANKVFFYGKPISLEVFQTYNSRSKNTRTLLLSILRTSNSNEIEQKQI